jgi:hypothetical protein
MTIGERKLFDLLEEYLVKSNYWKFNNYKKPRIQTNVRPGFLQGLELDFYIEEYNVAFEFQGEQHYYFVDKFLMKREDLIKRLVYDVQKDLLCKKNGIILIKINAKSLFYGAFMNSIYNAFNNYYGYCHSKPLGGHKPSSFSMILDKYSPEHKIFFSAIRLPKSYNLKKQYNSIAKKYLTMALYNKDFSSKMNYSFSHIFWKIFKKMTNEMIKPFLKTGISSSDVKNHALTIYF